MSTALAPGFTDPVFDAQRVFRAVLDALARPGLVRALPTADLAPPRPLAPELAALALALADSDAPVWLDASLRTGEVAAFLRFHTGARLVDDAAEATFALVSGPDHLPPPDALADGTDAYPDRSTTLVVALPALDGGPHLEVHGPGIRGRVALAPAGLPAGLLPELIGRNTALFPRGIDVLFVAGGRVLGLPRSTRLLGREAA